MAHMRRATALAVALAAVMLAAPASASAFGYTHRLKVTVEYRYDWSLTANRECQRSGSGFFSAKVSTRSVRVRAEHNRTANRFLFGVPYGTRGMRDLAPQRLLGTYEAANNAPLTGMCAADKDTERSACGTKPVPKRAQILASGLSHRRIDVVVGDVSGGLSTCRQPGLLSGISDLFRPRLSLNAPSRRQLRRHSATISRRQSVRLNIDEDGVGTGTGVRTVRLVLTRL
jgi:hypothetical protein